jgi:hypothetical protein
MFHVIAVAATFAVVLAYAVETSAMTRTHNPWMGLLKLFVGVTRFAVRASELAGSLAQAVKCGPESRG